MKCEFQFISKCTYRTIVKTELFSIRYFLICKHADRIFSLPHFVYRLTIRTTRMTEPTCKVTVKNWVNGEDIVAFWVVHVTLESNVVEVWKIFWKPFGVLTLLDYILLFKPVPWPIYLSKILNY